MAAFTAFPTHASPLLLPSPSPILPPSPSFPLKSAMIISQPSSSSRERVRASSLLARELERLCCVARRGTANEDPSSFGFGEAKQASPPSSVNVAVGVSSLVGGTSKSTLEEQDAKSLIESVLPTPLAPPLPPPTEKRGNLEEEEEGEEW